MIFLKMIFKIRLFFLWLIFPLLELQRLIKFLHQNNRQYLHNWPIAIVSKIYFQHYNSYHRKKIEIIIYLQRINILFTVKDYLYYKFEQQYFGNISATMIRDNNSQNIQASTKYIQYQNSSGSSQMSDNENQNYVNGQISQNICYVKKGARQQIHHFAGHNMIQSNNRNHQIRATYYPYSISDISANTFKIQSAYNINSSNPSFSKKEQSSNQKIKQKSSKNQAFLKGPKSQKKQIFVSQFVVDQYQNQKTYDKKEPQNEADNNNNQIMTNIERIINCKNETASLISQVETYIQFINKLKNQNKNYKLKLQDRQIQNRQMKDIIHCKQMQITQLRQEKQKLLRLYTIQCKKVSVLKSSYLSSQRQKWEQMLRQNLLEIQQHFSMNNISDQQYSEGQQFVQLKSKINEKYVNTDPKIMKTKNNFNSINNSFIHNQSNQHQKQNTNSIKRTRNNSYQNPQNSNKAIKRIQRSINISKIIQEGNENGIGKIIKKQSNIYGTIKHRNWCQESTII